MGFKKIIDDTLKSPNGKWSRKNLTTFISFIMSIILGIFITISHFITDNPVSNEALMVFFGFLSMTGYKGYLALQDKIENRNNKNK